MFHTLENVTESLNSTFMQLAFMLSLAAGTSLFDDGCVERLKLCDWRENVLNVLTNTYQVLRWCYSSMSPSKTLANGLLRSGGNAKGMQGNLQGEYSNKAIQIITSALFAHFIWRKFNYDVSLGCGNEGNSRGNSKQGTKLTNYTTYVYASFPGVKCQWELHKIPERWFCWSHKL